MVRSTDLDETLKDTLRCVEFFDRLFDCLNVVPDIMTVSLIEYH